MAKALVDAFSVAPVGLMDGPDDPWILLGIPVTDLWRLVLGGAVIHQNDLHILSPCQQRVYTFFHIRSAIIAGYCKSNQFHMIAPFHTFILAWLS